MAGLTRRLGLPEAIGLSVSIMAPSMAMAFNVTLAAAAAGPAMPLAFALGTLLLLPVALCFAGFGRVCANAGSATAYIGRAFGARAGLVAGWTLLLAYLGFASGTAGLIGNFFDAAADSLGLGLPPLWLPVSLLGLALASGCAWRDMRLAGRLMLALEGLALLAILALVAAILAAVAPGAARIGGAFSPAAAPRGWAGIGYALVFAVLSFGGFEGAATLGEETRRPRRDIPLAMLGSLGAVGLFFILVAFAEVAGFGPDHADALAASAAPLDALARRYLSRGFAAALDAANIVSAFACTLGAISAAARLVFALGRAGLAPGLGTVHPTHGTPGRAILAVGAACLAAFLLGAPLAGSGTFYGEAGTVGALALMLVYVAVGAAWAVTAGGAAGRVIGIAAALTLLWPLYATLWPVPAFPDNLWPYVVAGWVALGALLLRRPAEPAGIALLRSAE